MEVIREILFWLNSLVTIALISLFITGLVATFNEKEGE